MVNTIKNFIKKEAVFFISALVAAVTMFVVPPDSEYLGYIDWRVLALLFCLMAVVAGFKSVGAFRWLTYQLLRRINSGRLLGVTLVLLPFFCSMLVTNDVALLIFVPFTVALLEKLGCGKSVIPLLVLQTVGANLGSMATPVGNPQNLFLYSAYNLAPSEFFAVTLPITAVSLLMLTASGVIVLPKKLPDVQQQSEKIVGKGKLAVYILLFILCLLTVFRVIYFATTAIIVTAVLLIAQRKLLKEIDYMLLLTFVCFFIISENLGRIDAVSAFLQDILLKSTLLTAVGTSQIISNVPAAVVLSGFTDNWRELLEGVNIGGLGTPVASLASIITLKLYMKTPSSNAGKFLAVFTAVNVVGLVILLAFAVLI